MSKKLKPKTITAKSKPSKFAADNSMTYKGKIGRTPIPIDLKKIEDESIASPTYVELAAALKIHVDTLTEWRKKPEVQEAIERGKAKGRATLRKRQYAKAMAGSDTMLIWLGKQLLDQKDKTLIGEDPDQPFVMIVNDVPRPQKGS